MNDRLEERVAIVTGGSRGIGRAITLALTQAGAKVAIFYAGNEAAAQETLLAVQQQGGKATAHKVNIQDTNTIKEAIISITTEKLVIPPAAFQHIITVITR